MMIAGGGGLISQGTDLLLSGSTFARNTAEAIEGVAVGGGVVLSGTTEATILGCEISSNAVKANSSTFSTTALAGGIFLEDSAIDIYDTAITGNSCMVNLSMAGPPGDVYGGGVFMSASSSKDVRITNCLIAGNMTLMMGGGLYVDEDINLDLTNCTIVSNQALFAGGGMFFNSGTSQATMTNCILWDNTGGMMGGMQLYTNAPVDLYSCDYADGSSDIGIGSGSFNPDGNCMNKIPLFVLGPNGKYYLSQIAAGQLSDSPCVDNGAGTAASLGLDTKTTRSDEVGDSGTVDMGYHYEP
jgi:hypothetical protein